MSPFKRDSGSARSSKDKGDKAASASSKSQTPTSVKPLSEDEYPVLQQPIARAAPQHHSGLPPLAIPRAPSASQQQLPSNAIPIGYWPGASVPPVGFAAYPQNHTASVVPPIASSQPQSRQQTPFAPGMMYHQPGQPPVTPQPSMSFQRELGNGVARPSPTYSRGPALFPVSTQHASTSSPPPMSSTSHHSAGTSYMADLNQPGAVGAVARRMQETTDEGKLSVGIDFGTTFTGVAYGSSRLFAGQIRQILVWPGSYETYRKVPSCIMYAQPRSQEEAQILAWGLEAKNMTLQPGMVKCEWFKLLLSPESLRSGQPDPRLPPLPYGKNVVDVISDFLREVWRYAKRQITDEIGSVVDLDAADVLLTVPAAWDAAGTSLMREAAIRAGLVQSSRGGDKNWRDRLQIITEPEAGAIHASTLATLHHLRPSQSFLLCDAGGGTVDTAVYKLMGQLSQLEIAEMCVRSGANAGSLFVDLKFEELIRKILRDHPEHLDPPSIAAFMHSFSETDKLDFHGTQDDDNVYRFNCFNVENSHDPSIGLEWGELCIPGRVLRKEVFDPIIEQVLDLLQFQLSKVASTRIDAIILVGGFAASEYLFTRVQQTFGASIAVIARPNDCDVATMRGAARYGLGLSSGKKAVSNVISPRSYIMKVKLPAEDVDRIQRPHFITVNDAGMEVCENRLSYLVAKGAVLRKGERLRSRFCKYVKSPQDNMFVAQLFVSDSEDLYRYTDEGDATELCRWTVDLSALPMYHVVAQKGGGYVSFDLGLSLDSAETTGSIAGLQSTDRSTQGGHSVVSAGSTVYAHPTAPTLNGVMPYNPVAHYSPPLLSPSVSSATSGLHDLSAPGLIRPRPVYATSAPSILSVGVSTDKSSVASSGLSSPGLTRHGTNRSTASTSMNGRQGVNDLTAIKESEGGLSVGIDFGTTFSGVAYGSTRLMGQGQVRQILTWPGSYESHRKVPTCILYHQATPNDEARILAWGIEAKSAALRDGFFKWVQIPAVAPLVLKTTSCRAEWFKLYLDPVVLREGRFATSARLPELPAGKEPFDIVVDYLTCLWTYAKARITEEIGSVADLESAVVQLTVPAQWDNVGCEIMRRAAIKAGMPEAAAIHASTLSTLHRLRASQSFIICDAGGGTVDTAAYRLIGQLSQLEIAEMCSRSGANCGSLFLDLRFEALVRKILQHHPIHLDAPSLLAFRHAFSETDKLAYQGVNDDETLFRFCCFNIEDGHDPSCGLEFGELLIPGAILRRDVFDPVVDQVLSLIESQLDKVPDKRVNALILVGGFAASQYLFSRVQEHFGHIVPVIARPQDCDVATLQGAARYGLGLTNGKAAVSSVICPRSYIMKVKLPAEDVDRMQRPGFITLNNAGIEVCENRLSYLVAKGAVLRKGQRLKSRFCKFSKGPNDTLFTAILFVSDADKIYRYTDEGEIYELCRWTVDLAALPSFQWNAQSSTGNGFYTEFDLGLVLDSAEVIGVLMNDEGEECGRATFEYISQCYRMRPERVHLLRSIEPDLVRPFDSLAFAFTLIMSPTPVEGPPAYSSLPVSDDHHVKPKLERQDSATPELLRRTNKRRSCTRQLMFLTGITLAICVIASTAYAVSLVLYGAPHAWAACAKRAKQPSTTTNDVTRHQRHNFPRQQASPTYSTTTNSNGDVSTFVYTTRPIINPAGATIGTLTGYVPLTTDVPASDTSIMTVTPTSPSSSSRAEPPTFSTTTFENSAGSATATSTFVYTTRPIVNPAGATIGTLTGYVPLTSAPTSTFHSITPSPKPSDSPSLLDDEFAVEIDLHLLHRRGVDFKAAYEQVVHPSPAPEFSFSSNQDGETVTFVKTTRAIVNPAGATIGTLNGAFVRYTPEAGPTAVAAHNELKRRQV
ncbi:hypothetical protein OIV83_003774 [Microbotryomycetes sp. JL201]|nr:hypothetical protein OIV83_003774 [Microbotryomycetes sp. JL201]